MRIMIQCMLLISTVRSLNVGRLQVLSRHREGVVGDMRKYVPSARGIAEVGSVSIFTAKQDNTWYCGITSSKEVDMECAVEISEDVAKFVDKYPYVVPLAASCASFTSNKKSKNAVVLGSGPSAQITRALLVALGLEATLVGPHDASSYTAATKDVLFFDLAGSESLRHPHYVSLISNQAREAIDQGVFAKANDITREFPVDTNEVASLLSTSNILQTSLQNIQLVLPKKNLLAGFLLRNLPGRSSDEYADFFQWPRDADNRGRRLGLELLYEASDSPFLLSKLAADASIDHTDIVHHPNNHRDFFDDPDFPPFLSGRQPRHSTTSSASSAPAIMKEKQHSASSSSS